MKNIYITLSFVIASSVLSAQNKETKAADKLYKKFEYVDAAVAYQKLVDNGQADAYVYKQMAESYYNIFNAKEASKAYEQAISAEKQDAETYYRYAQMLKASGQIQQANKQMQEFASMKPNDDRAKAFKADPNYLPKLKEQAKMYDIIPSDISSDKSDFGAVLTNDNEVYFTSARNESRKTYGWNEEPFLDIYKAIYNANGTISEATLVEGVNTKWHDGPATISADGNTMYFASESYNDKLYEKDKVNKLRYSQVNLYKATKVDGKWSNIKALPFNSKEYSTSSPSLSKDGKTLYFSSNMPGSKGGVDIWKVSINADEYGTPQNAGDKVNTAGNESFPFISDENTLFFSSDAKQGFGGLDVFEIDLNKNTEAKNVGQPVNSEKDDFAFTYNANKKVGFFSSNREGVDNIYKADPVCGVLVISKVKNAKTGNMLSDAKVVLLDKSNTIIATKMTDASGTANFDVSCDESYSLEISKAGFDASTFDVAKTRGGEVKTHATLEPVKPIITETEVILQPIYFEFDKSNITQEGAEELDKLVEVMNEHAEMVIFAKSHTDNRGKDKYNLNLSDRRAKATVQYIISKDISKERITGQGFGETELKVACGEECTEEQHAQNRRSEFLIVKK
jgi:outer membrane protein OmpA-like peptidoglycan-associated protein/tetratricopeptide (TPR) repeat protein